VKQNGLISGNGSSLSISATGAVSSGSASFVNAPEFDSVTVGVSGSNETVEQDTTNIGNITNTNNNNSVIDAGNVSGHGASVSVSATGAASALSVSSIANYDVGQDQNITIGEIDQDTYNRGTILNNGGSLETDNISGKGASVSVSGSGAISAVSVSSILDAQQLGDVNVIDDISQTTTNSGNVTNVGNVTTGALTGNGASVSVSALGAASSVSFSSIK
jgi:hypothetical protein